MMTSTVESVCIFGSAARKTLDTLSDKDVLIVAGNTRRRQLLAKKWAGDGWSVAVYTPNRIIAMVRKGSLFVQHLKREGIIITDNQGWLSSILHLAEPKRSYEDDFLLAVQMLKPLERLRLGYWPQLMAADLGFVFIRNAGIYALAEQGIYEFAYERIVLELADVASLTVSEVKILQHLRALKVAYRSRNNTVVDLCDHNALLEICAKVARTNVLLKVSEYAPVRLFPIRYASLRDVEARMIMQFDVGMLDKGGLSDDVSSLWKMVVSPREYSWEIRKIDPAWIARANEILTRKAHQGQVAGENYFSPPASQNYYFEHKDAPVDPSE